MQWYWPIEREQAQMRVMQEQVWTQRTVIWDDPACGTRVLCLSQLPRLVYGTVQTAVRCSNEHVSHVRCWRVVTDDGTMLEEPERHFAPYEHHLEVRVGNQVCYHGSGGGEWDAVVLGGQLAPDGFRVRIRILHPGHELVFACHPNRFRGD